MSKVAFIALAVLFFLKVLWNFSVPYTLIAHGPPPPGQRSNGISMIPIEVLFVPIGAVLAFFTEFSWPWNPGGVALFGTALVVASYLHLSLVRLVVAWTAHKFRNRDRS